MDQDTAGRKETTFLLLGRQSGGTFHFDGYSSSRRPQQINTLHRFILKTRSNDANVYPYIINSITRYASPRCMIESVRLFVTLSADYEYYNDRKYSLHVT